MARATRAKLLSGARVRLANAGQTSPPGINVIGHLSSSAGLGNTARLYIELLRHKGHEVAGFDVEAYAREEAPDLAPGMLVEDIRALPFVHNLVIVSMDRLPRLWLRQARNISEPRFRNAGLIFWELPVIPPAWLPALRMFDVMLTCSQYVRQTLETAIPEVPTIHAEHPLRPLAALNDGERRATRAKYGIPSDSIAFCCTFDPRSGLPRKNPLGAIKAWLRAFPSRRDVCLVIKSNGTPSAADPELAEILGHTQRDPRIVWLPGRIGKHEEVMTLFSCCDVFVSLHRAEGLGLVPMEVMALGKIVIATGYSGNMTFMTEQNSLPVSYRLVKPADDLSFFAPRFSGFNASWAEPDLVRAASLMQLAADDAELSTRLSRQAKSDISVRQVTAWQGPWRDEMFRLLDASRRAGQRAKLRRSMLVKEFFSPTLVRLNAVALLRHMKQRAPTTVTASED